MKVAVGGAVAQRRGRRTGRSRSRRSRTRAWSPPSPRRRRGCRRSSWRCGRWCRGRRARSRGRGRRRGPGARGIRRWRCGRVRVAPRTIAASAARRSKPVAPKAAAEAIIGSAGVADHGHALAVGVGPARQAAALGGVGEQRADHVARRAAAPASRAAGSACGRCPSRRSRRTGCGRGAVDAPVHADVGAADVAEGARRQERRGRARCRRCRCRRAAPPPTRIRPSACVPAALGRGRRPRRSRAAGFSAARLARASSTLTKETPTRARTDAVAAGVEGRVGAGVGGRRAGSPAGLAALAAVDRRLERLLPSQVP